MQCDLDLTVRLSRARTVTLLTICALAFMFGCSDEDASRFDGDDAAMMAEDYATEHPIAGEREDDMPMEQHQQGSDVPDSDAAVPGEGSSLGTSASGPGDDTRVDGDAGMEAITVEKPKGVVIAHEPASAARFIGSPALVRMPSGTLVASHDLFISGDLATAPPTMVHRSQDGGEHWEQVAQLERQFWSSLFLHGGVLYLMGTAEEYGDVVIRRSEDEGLSWSEPEGPNTGLLTSGGRYHTAPTPVVVHGGRVWRGIETVEESLAWPDAFAATLFWAEADADLLRAESWQQTNKVFLPEGETARGWLEGNPVISPGGKLVDILRVHVRDEQERAAILTVDDPSGTPSLSSVPTFIALNGGSKKFSIRFDQASMRYLTLVNVVDGIVPGPAGVRNRLALASSSDLLEWTYHTVLLAHEDAEMHGFQYAEWLTDGDDLLFVSRTAADDETGGAPYYHDANYLTFHRVRGFRELLSESFVP